MNAVVLGLASLLPMMVGPLPPAQRSITAALCIGGQIEIPVKQQKPEPAPPCAEKACHAGCNRRKFDLSQ
ncbi:hypothetical protein [Qipengyuania sp. RANM35]|uniref:hypothetical protein n=1 Tax=Qipengyuania sp. RANM35 TaxID=3068635 RepID=UPI0034DB2601